jgi:hypothetical protein
MSEELPPECFSAAGEVLPPNTCPSCRHELDAATAVDPSDNSRPSPGHWTVCVHCTSFLVFGDDFALRLASVEEVAEMADEHRNLLLRVRRRIQEFIAHERQQKLKRAIRGDG